MEVGESESVSAKKLKGSFFICGRKFWDKFGIRPLQVPGLRHANFLFGQKIKTGQTKLLSNQRINLNFASKNFSKLDRPLWFNVYKRTSDG